MTNLQLINKKPKLVPKIFCHHNASDTRIADAVLASAAIPFVYPAVRLKKMREGCYVQRPEGDAYIDGGLVAKVIPATLFDPATRSLRETDRVEGDSIPLCEPARFAEYLREALHVQDEVEIKASAEFNKATLCLQVATPMAIKQLTGGNFQDTTCPLMHPLQALEEKLTQSVNNDIFGPRYEEIQKNNHGRIVFIRTPINVSSLTFVLNKPQISALLAEGEAAIKEAFPSKVEEFASRRTPVSIADKRRVEKESKAIEKENAGSFFRCVML